MNHSKLSAILTLTLVSATTGQAKTVKAWVAALDQAITFNRMGAVEPGGMVYALMRDVIPAKGVTPQPCSVLAGTPQACQAGQVMLRGSRRPRPLVLRVNVGDDLEIHFTNLLAKAQKTASGEPLGASTATRRAGLHVVGLQWTTGPQDDASFVGGNANSLPAPGDPEVVYTLHAATEGAYLLSSPAGPLGGTGAGQTSAGMFGSVTVEPKDAVWFRSQVTKEDLDLAADGHHTTDGQPVINDYLKTYPAGAKWPWPDFVPIAPNTPILAMLNSDNEIVHSDLTAIVTGPITGANPFRFIGRLPNSAEPRRDEPFREFTIIYHSDFQATQAYTTITGYQNPGSDAFGINYGFGGIAAEITANRLGVGPMGGCTDCKFEEFFLSSWVVGDPAMLVDCPANGSGPKGCHSGSTSPPVAKMVPDPPVNPPTAFNPGKNPFSFNPPKLQATQAFYPDDPSNVYHSYLSDHVTFRILSADSDLHHIHHQHAQQWLHTPNSKTSTYLDSQAIGPGSAFTLEMTYDGSGNRNKTIGDSIFHCHFYPHFAQGMWSMWRVHDVFEAGTELDPKTGKPTPTSRALPDAEILTGTPTPALVPMPTIAMAPMPSAVHIKNGQVVYDTVPVTKNPGYPFWIPGEAGQRSPAPPLDVAKNPAFNPSDPTSREFLDGGLPRHIAGGAKSTFTQWETLYNFSKDIDKLEAKQLPEDGTDVEKVAMAYSQAGHHPSFTPENVPRDFVTNGMGPKPGAPYADPCLPNPTKGGRMDPMRQYKAADIQVDAILNKKGWHFPQQRMLALWGDVIPTLFGDEQMKAAPKAPEPFFFRAESGDCIEYWQTNLVPKYYELDNFQVRTPTDILGQHIHLVKFDVTSSDGAANGFNYEDGTMSPEEVQERVAAINKNGGLVQTDGVTKKLLTAVKPFYFCDNPGAAYFKEYCDPNPSQPGKWVGARTTIQRWWADPLTNGDTPSQGEDRTMRTVFTHDHFGPSTHQQAGLYAALVIEPTTSNWFMPDPHDPNGVLKMGDRTLTADGKTFPDGGPTSWQASVITTPADQSYREFMLALQDMQLAYMPNSKSKPGGTPGGFTGSDPSKFGWYSNPATVVNNTPVPGPQLVSEGFNTGTYSVNYRNEPVPFRTWNPVTGKQAPGEQGDLSFVYQSRDRADTCLNAQPVFPTSLGIFNPTNGSCGSDPGGNLFKYPAPLQPADNTGKQYGIFGGDPFTPLLRAYQNDKVQVRLIAGSHLVAHDFSMPGLKWFFEPSDHNSGYRNNQLIGISEHFELLFTLPPTNGAADYQYLADSSQYGVQNGLWGLIRAYDGKKDGKQPGLPFLPNNPQGGAPASAKGGCPAGAPSQVYTVYAITASQIQVPGGPPNKEFLNFRENVYNKGGLLYVLKEDFDDVTTGKRLPEPLVLRAAAGDCVHVTLVNKFDTTQPIFQTDSAIPTLNILGAVPSSAAGGYNIKLPASMEVGLAPQLLSFDVTQNFGTNVGKNPTQTTCANKDCEKTYVWYAGALFDPDTGQYAPHPVEFGATNLFASDPINQLFEGLGGALIVEPQGSTWETDVNSKASATVRPVTPGAFETFREFVVLTEDNINQFTTLTQPQSKTCSGSSVSCLNATFQSTSAVNYGTEPWWLRLGVAAGPGGGVGITPNSNNFQARAFDNIDLSCGLSDKMVSIRQSILPSNVRTALQLPAAPTVGDMFTPVYVAGAGSRVRFRVLNPGGINDLVFELHGHSWQEEPYQNGSRNIGFNPVSEWQGARMGHGPRNHFDAVIAKAGGENAVPGDYLYRSRTSIAFRGGMFGVFRVSQPGKDSITITADTSTLPEQIVYGFNTVNPDTGKFAASVDVFAPGAPSGGTCTGTKIATIPLNAGDPATKPFGSSMNGAWWAKTTATTICAVSNFGGLGSVDLTQKLISSCTKIVPPSAPAAAAAKATSPRQKRNDDMLDMFDRHVQRPTIEKEK